MSDCSILALVSHEDLHLFRIDVVLESLKGNLPEDVYMEQTPSFEVGDATKVVCKLVKALYGLRKASRQWYFTIKYFLRSLCGVDCNNTDECFYIDIWRDAYLELLSLNYLMTTF